MGIGLWDMRGVMVWDLSLTTSQLGKGNGKGGSSMTHREESIFVNEEVPRGFEETEDFCLAIQ